MTQGAFMDFPCKAICLFSTTSRQKPNDVVPPFTVFDVQSRMGGTHVYHATLGEDETFILHITTFLFLKPETDPQLYRRAVARKGTGVDQTYYTQSYNSPIAWQLRRRDEELKFCMTSEDAMLMAVNWDGRKSNRDDNFTPEVCNQMANEYIRYAEILEKFERVIDANWVDELKANQKELKHAC